MNNLFQWLISSLFLSSNHHKLQVRPLTSSLPIKISFNNSTAVWLIIKKTSDLGRNVILRFFV